MKRIVFTALLAIAATFGMQAQKFALIDMEYIMKAIPSFESANDQLEQLSLKWQREVEAMLTEVQTMYKNYQTELVLLTDDMKTKREEEIIAKEQAANELKRKYFGPDGELYKKRESLMKPIQDEIYNAVQELCNEKGYQMIIDKSSDMSLIYASPKLDVSDELLNKLGYSK